MDLHFYHFDFVSQQQDFAPERICPWYGLNVPIFWKNWDGKNSLAMAFLCSMP
jgi:hypothetical protein